MKKIRCAIYTRKSSEEGLDQDFNSLDAQREACAAYIASQKQEGWVLLPQHYDDGGISGGTMDRPALQRLLHDVDEGLVDQIIVYKIDRLTRSLSDFAKLVDQLDAAEASFVSVTQSFNTSTSMGRLTLNVLLSFAQFEREVTAERIRDKISASKKKGLWMGGTVPIGYQADGRTLKINKKEAEIIELIYSLYQKYHHIRDVQLELEKCGIRSKERIIQKRTSQCAHDKPDQQNSVTIPIKTGDVAFSKTHIHFILTNPIYAGRIRHKDNIYDGQHPAIINPETWQEVQSLLIEKSARQRGNKTSIQTSLLSGCLYDETGDRLTPSHTKKNKRRYRYYISNRLIGAAQTNSQADGTSKPSNGWRLPAQLLEDQIATAIVEHLTTHIAKNLFKKPNIENIERTGSILNNLRTEVLSNQNSTALRLLKQARINTGMIRIELDPLQLAKLIKTTEDELNPDILTCDKSFQIRKRGVEAKLIIGSLHANERDQILINNISHAHQYYAAIKSGQSFDQITETYNITKRRLLQIINLAFIAPDITKSIMMGDQPIGLTSKWLIKNPLPSDWQAQRQIISRL